MQRALFYLVLFLFSPIWLPIILISGIIQGISISNRKLQEKYLSQLVGPEHAKRISNNINGECNHEFVWADNLLYLKNPPERKMICKKCGKISFIAGVINPVYHKN